MPEIPALRRQRQVDLCEFKAGLVFSESFRTARAVTQKNLVSKKEKEKNLKKKEFQHEWGGATEAPPPSEDLLAADGC